MTRNELIAFTKELARSLQNDDTLDVFINEVFRRAARSLNPPLVKSAIQALTSGTAEYAYKDTMLRILYAIMHDELLTIDSDNELDAYSSTQESDTGTPTSLTEDSETARQYRLYPEPDFSSDAVIPVHGEPYGEDFADNSLVLLFADDRETDIPDIFALPFAFEALSSEFLYPSDHTDDLFAANCLLVASIFRKLLGVA